MVKLKCCLLTIIPKKCGLKYLNWHDGFVKAIKILIKEYDYNISIFNLEKEKYIDFNEYNCIIIKSNKLVEDLLNSKYNNWLKIWKLKIKICCIGNSKWIPDKKGIEMFDILLYETDWYYKFASLNRHNYAFKAFGVDTDIMKPIKIKKEFDCIFVGSVCKYKRPLKILNIQGKKCIIGQLTDKNIISKLKDNKDIKVYNFQSYENLSLFYNKSKLCYVPCILQGGGERAVLEARACGIPVKIENDNPKLKELLNGKIYTSYDYASQINKAIITYINNITILKVI